ncbi:hypothetical protein HC891_14020, partial [Candidatus Gracilibacteria bacterium]|nr:hypothetical protein [Candidatus Gracilibacteria bacterium]
MQQHRTFIPLLLALIVGFLTLLGTRSMLVRGAASAPDTPLLTYPAFPPTPTPGQSPALASALPTIAPTDLLADWQAIDAPTTLPGEGGRWLVRDIGIVQAGTHPADNISPRITMLISPNAATAIQVAVYDQYNGTAGLISHYHNNSFYRLRVQRDGESSITATVLLEKVIDGKTRILAQETQLALPRYTWQTLRLAMEGTTLVARLDDQILARVTDAEPLPTGRVGLLTRALGGIRFDQVVVEEVQPGPARRSAPSCSPVCSPVPSRSFRRPQARRKTPIHPLWSSSGSAGGRKSSSRILLLLTMQCIWRQNINQADAAYWQKAAT